MAPKRTLPAQGNPQITPEHTPGLEHLVERRRLGQTNLTRPGQLSISSASQSHNFGPFDYAHLRVPLPKDLAGSGIFSLTKSGTYPESYFLMRRSSDGHISATGMFKAAFPWASVEEEEFERKYHKSMTSAGKEEVAGNVWIHPDEALSLAEDYGLTTWIIALLDGAPIEKGTTKDKERLEIATPPRFEVSEKLRFAIPPNDTTSIASSVRSRNRRERRSASPSKIATPSRKIASPRKPRTSRKTKLAEEAAAATAATSSALSQVIENGASAEPSVISESVDSERVDNDHVRVEVNETTEHKGDTDVTTTSVAVVMPADAPELPLPKDTNAMVEAAREIVEQATKSENAVNGVGTSKKRKADTAELDEDAEGSTSAGPVAPPAKKVKQMEESVRKEKMKFRATVGIALTLAVGAAIPYFI